MNKIDTSHINDPLKLQPLTGKSLEFLQDSNIQMISNLANAFSYSGNASGLWPVVLYGCMISGNAISNGFFYRGTFSGECFILLGANVSSYINPPLCVPYNIPDPVADPVTFSDGSIESVHIIRRYRIQDLPLSGAPIGSFLYSDFIFKDLPPVALTTGNSWSNGPSVIKINNVTHMRGYTTLTANDSEGLSFSLPEGYRPSVSRIFPSVVYDDAYEQLAATITILNTGEISVQANWASSHPYLGIGRRVYFDGLTFPV